MQAHLEKRLLQMLQEEEECSASAKIVDGCVLF
jgi:hypothetical protein